MVYESYSLTDIKGLERRNIQELQDTATGDNNASSSIPIKAYYLYLISLPLFGSRGLFFPHLGYIYHPFWNGTSLSGIYTTRIYIHKLYLALVNC